MSTFCEILKWSHVFKKAYVCVREGERDNVTNAKRESNKKKEEDNSDVASIVSYVVASVLRFVEVYV